MALLIAVEGPLAGKRFTLAEKVVLGRAEDAQVRIPDLMVTRRHCTITPTAKGHMIEDLGSRNGTCVNDKLITAPTILNSGDTIRIHDTLFRFVVGGDTGSSYTVVAVSEAEPATVVKAIKTSSVQAGGAGAHMATATPESLVKAHERLEIVLSIGNAVNAHVELDSLLNEILESFFRVFPQMDRGFIMLQEPSGGEMQVRLARQRDEKSPETISVSRHIIQETVQQRISILSADAMGDKRFADAGSVLSLKIRSMMCAPLIASDELIGVIHVDTKQQDRRFTRDDLELFTAVANQTALAISASRMHEKLRVRQRVEHDLALARHVQNSFLPSETPKIPGFEFCATYRSALEVGGDFYDFIPLKDGRLAIVLGDVIGKGMPAALMMVRMMSNVRFMAMADPGPASLMDRLNDTVAHQPGESAFVTMLFALLDPASRQIRLASAGHWPPVLRKGKSGEAADVAMENGFVLGTAPDAKYQETAVTLEPGDAMVFFTDGVSEAQNADGAAYGAGRLLKAVAPSPASAPVIMEGILQDLRAFVGDNPQSDDLTLLCMGVA